MKIVLGLLVLLYASLQDIKYREIDDKSWMSLVLLGVIFLIFDYSRGIAEILIPFAFSAGFTLAVVAILYFTGIMGSGDCKILFGISVLLPSPMHFSIFPIFSLGVLTNAIILSLIVPLLFFIYNLGRLKDVRSIKEFLLLFLGYKRIGSDIKPYEVAMENEEGVKMFLNTKNLELGEKLSTNKEVWVSPAIPFVVFITAGFFVSVLLGDFISYASLIWGVI